MIAEWRGRQPGTRDLRASILSAATLRSSFGGRYHPDCHGHPGRLSHLSNLNNLLNTTALIAIVAIGEAVVILARQIDLSVGAILGICAYLVGEVAGHVSGPFGPVVGVLLPWDWAPPLVWVTPY